MGSINRFIDKICKMRLEAGFYLSDVQTAFELYLEIVIPLMALDFSREDLYRSKDGKEERIFDALEWLAAMCSHVPNKGQ